MPKDTDVPTSTLKLSLRNSLVRRDDIRTGLLKAIEWCCEMEWIAEDANDNGVSLEVYLSIIALMRESWSKAS